MARGTGLRRTKLGWCAMPVIGHARSRIDLGSTQPHRPRQHGRTPIGVRPPTGVRPWRHGRRSGGRAASSTPDITAAHSERSSFRRHGRRSVGRATTSTSACRRLAARAAARPLINRGQPRTGDSRFAPPTGPGRPASAKTPARRRCPLGEDAGLREHASASGARRHHLVESARGPQRTFLARGDRRRSSIGRDGDRR